MKKSGYLVALATLMVSSGPANAAGFALIEQSGSSIGNAFAGTAATAEDASTIFFNPAGMTYLPDNQLVVAGYAIRPSIDFSNRDSSTLVGHPLLVRPMTGGDGGDAGGWALLPNFYYARDIKPGIKAGIGVNSPFGLTTEYDSNWVGRYDAIKSDLKTVNINPSLAFRVNDKLSIGGGISAQYIDVELTSAVDFGSTCTLLSGAIPSLTGCAAPQARDGRLKLIGDDWSWGYNLGLLFEPVQGTRVGLAYRSKIDHHLKGDARFSNVPAQFAPVPPLAAATANGSIKADVTLPETASLSLFHQASEQWSVMGDITWTRWSQFKELRVERSNGTLIGVTQENWENTLRYSLGASYKYSDAWKLRAGVAYDESPVPDAFRTPRIPDGNRWWLALGANYKISQSNMLDVGYVHIFVQDVSVNLNNPVTSAAPSITRNLVGNYDSNINIFSLQYTHTF